MVSWPLLMVLELYVGSKPDMSLPPISSTHGSNAPFPTRQFKGRFQPVLNLQPLCPVSTGKELGHGQETWSQSGTKSLLD